MEFNWLGRFPTIVAALLSFMCAAWAQVDVHGPSGSAAFGTAIAVLPNGNFVVTDPGYSTPTAAAIGAVYLFNPNGNLISKLTGSTANDRVGNGGIYVLTNGNFVVSSYNWANGAVGNAGAATWSSATAGLNGVVSQSNSLVGTQADDQVSNYRIAALANGNYVVSSRMWHGGYGAATWGNGVTGTAGAVSAANSLIGNSDHEFTSFDGIYPLPNGDYVVASSNWQTSVGAATWCNGAGATSAKVSAANSIVGSHAGDFVGVGGVYALGSGNYLVRSPYWQNGAAVQAGAVTWANASGTTVGVINASNSLVGTYTTDHVGDVTVLMNGNYVVSSPNWFGNRGAVTWGDGSMGTTGEVSPGNSFISPAYTEALTDGNFVIVDSYWNNGDVYAGGTASVGAVIWADGTQPLLGTISAGDAMVGTHTDDRVGYGGIAALKGGRFAIASMYWNGGLGAITLAGGFWPTSGTVSAENSITGDPQNYIGGVGSKVVALSDGNYVFTTDYVAGGLATWRSADDAGSGSISRSDSITGFIHDATVVPTDNANWILFSPHWTTDQVAMPDRGAVTLIHGGHPVSGPISDRNGVLGGVANAGAQLSYGYDSSRDHLVVGRPAENVVTLFDGNFVFENGFE